MGFFSKISEGLKKTRESLKERFDDVFSGGHVDEDLFDELEEALVLADTGAVTAGAICEELRKRVKKEGVSDPEKVREMMYEVVAEMLRGGQELNIENKPAIIMMIGVNGAGKTTTIGKLAKNFIDEGKKVVGRIHGIIQRQFNEINNKKQARFTRFDCIENQDVANALFKAVEDWALSKGMDEVVGPLGFSDLEREGLLIEGFDELSTFEEQYNYEYYQKLKMLTGLKESYIFLKP